MRTANTKLQMDRRDEILAAAEHCFARYGFHQASMQAICADAGLSPGSVYRYFPSKEAIIAGIAERDRADSAERFQAITEASDFFAALAQAARHYIVEQSTDEICLRAEIKAESRRNPEIAKIYAGIEEAVKGGLVAMLRTAAERGDIPKNIDFDISATMLMALVDGLYWRRAVDTTFDAEAALPTLLSLVHFLLTQPEQHAAKIACAAKEPGDAR